MSDKTIYEIRYTEYFGENERGQYSYFIAESDEEALEYARWFAKNFYRDEDDEERAGEVLDTEDIDDEVDEVDEVDEWEAEHPFGDCTMEIDSVRANPYIIIGETDECIVLTVSNMVSWERANSGVRMLDMKP